MKNRKTWLKKKYGFDIIPSNISHKKLFKIFAHALSKNKIKVVINIIKDFPSFHDYEDNLVIHIYAHQLSLLETAFASGLHPDAGNSGFLRQVHDSPELTKLGLKYGANINSTNCSGEVALGFACTWGNIDVVRILIDAGADVNFIEGVGPDHRYKYTALDSAQNHKEIYDLLKANGGKHHHEIIKNKV